MNKGQFAIGRALPQVERKVASFMFGAAGSRNEVEPSIPEVVVCRKRLKWERGCRRGDSLQNLILRGIQNLLSRISTPLEGGV